MKKVLFTGATGDLGYLCVKALSESGRWFVFAAGTKSKKLDELGALKNVVPVKMDITSEKSVLAARELILLDTDRLDAIINFAGIGAFHSMVEGDCIDVTQKVLAVNVIGMIRVNRMMFDLIRAGQGRIINCSSEAGWMTPQPFAGPYFLSKRAVEAYNDCLRRELMFMDIPVIKIQPGPFKTGLTESIYEQYDTALENTKWYRDVLKKMKRLMVRELSQKNNPTKLVRVVLHALEARGPKIRYKVGTSKLLVLLELLPERCVDQVYKLILISAKKEKA